SLSSDWPAGDADAIQPVLAPNGSDSAQLDNALELLVAAGRSLPHALTMLVPEAWEDAASGLDERRRAFFAYHATLTEPWDGPAAIAFTDGDRIGAMLDKNGLRPARWVLTSDDVIVVASEVGAVDVPVESVVRKGRLGPGQMLLVDLRAGQLLEDEAIKTELAARRPYARWMKRGRVRLADLKAPAAETTVPNGNE